MRSGWPHTQEEPGTLASQQQAQYGPADSWPNGYPALGYTEGDYRYPTHGMDPYAVELPAPGASPAGEHPYAAFGGAAHGTGEYTTPDIEAFGYGDPGYSDPRYDGPAAQDAGIAGTQTVRGVVESAHDGGYPGGAAELAYPRPTGQQDTQAPDVYHQPWDYDQPLRYDDEEPAYPLQDSYGQTTRAPATYDPADYNGSDFSVPGITGPGYDLSGIIGTGEFPGIGYDQPGYDRLSYDDPRYDFRFETRNSTRFDMPAVEDEPRGMDTRFDMPALGEPPASRHHDSTRFDMPAVDFDSSRLDHFWPAREDLPGPAADSFAADSFADGSFAAGSVNQTSLDLGAANFAANETRFDMPAVEDYQYGDRFEQTSVDGMRALAPETEFRPAGAGLVAPADEQPMNWADETSFDRFGDLDEMSGQDVPAAFTGAPEAAPLQTGPNTGPRRPVGKRRGRSSDKRQWLALGAICVAAAGAISFVMMKTVFSGPGGPAHSVSTPDKVAGFTREPNLEQQMKVSQLRNNIIANGGGKISDPVAAVYQQGSSAVGSNPQTYVFVGGKLADSDPQASLTNFEQTYKQGHAHAVSPGSLGGDAACGTATVSGESVSMCVWFDNDTFGEFVSPTMTPTELSSTMVQARPNVEHLAQ